jgi:hypothetical protein
MPDPLVKFSIGGSRFLISEATLGITPIEIPIPPGLPLFDMRTRLEGRDYDLRFDWNGRERRWYLARFSCEGIVIARGVKVIADFPLLLHYKSHPLCPQGTLVALDYSDQRGEPPDYVDLGTRVRVLYFPAPEDPGDVGDLSALAE